MDLDGTLLRSDLLHESAVLAFKRSPVGFVGALARLLQGRAQLKQRLAELSELPVEHLPYREDVLSWLREKRNHGARLVLCTASTQVLAERVAAHLGCFDEVIGSTASTNLKGSKKAHALVERFGAQGFSYVGDTTADIPVWRAARQRYCVAGTKQQRLVSQVDGLQSIGSAPVPASIGAWLRLLRVYQWVKNLLLFVPLLMAHKLFESDASGYPYLASALIAVLSFCLCASSVYVLNDLFDLEADRRHLRKRSRPLATGQIGLPVAALVSLALLAMAALLSATLPSSFQLALGLYYALTLGYSLVLKQIVLIDILVLAALYTIRVLAGGLALQVLVSFWLLAFSLFLFFSLACVKRFSELYSLRQRQEQISHGRGYLASDLEQIAQFGTASAYLSVLVMALYMNSDEVLQLYSQPGLLWLICPALLYWLSRTWLLAHRGQLHDDPIVFALRDSVSYLVGALCLLLMYLAI